jgi:hypothetical protein
VGCLLDVFSVFRLSLGLFLGFCSSFFGSAVALLRILPVYVGAPYAFISINFYLSKKKFNVAHPLLKHIFFDRNQPTCNARGSLGTNLPKISLKNLKQNILKKFKNQKKNTLPARGWPGHPQRVWPPATPIWPHGGGLPTQASRMEVARPLP